MTPYAVPELILSMERRGRISKVESEVHPALSVPDREDIKTALTLLI